MLEIKTYFFVLLLLVSTSCSRAQDSNQRSQLSINEIDIPSHLSNVENLTVYPNDTESTHEIHLVRETRFGSSDILIIGRVGDVEVDDSGLVYIPDIMSSVVHVFNPDGTYLQSIGREGSGPGEFRIIGELMIHAEELYVYDGEVKLIHSFSLETLEYLNTIYVQPQNTDEFEDLHPTRPSFSPRAIIADGSIILDGPKIRNRYWEPENPDEDGSRYLFLLSADGMRVERKIFEQPFSFLYSGYSFVPAVSYDNSPLISISNEGYFYSAMSNEFMISKYDLEGNHLQTFYYPFEKRSLTETEAESVIRSTIPEVVLESRLDALRDLGAPDVWPVLNDLESDSEGRLWVSTITDSDNTYDWWVLENQGELIGKVSLPRNESFAEMKNGYLYTYGTDNQGLREIVKYRIDLTEKS